MIVLLSCSKRNVMINPWKVLICRFPLNQIQSFLLVSFGLYDQPTKVVSFIKRIGNFWQKECWRQRFFSIFISFWWSQKTFYKSEHLCQKSWALQLHNIRYECKTPCSDYILGKICILYYPLNIRRFRGFQPFSGVAPTFKST